MRFTHRLLIAILPALVEMPVVTTLPIVRSLMA
jgi:hypothetical protein